MSAAAETPGTTAPGQADWMRSGLNAACPRPPARPSVAQDPLRHVPGVVTAAATVVVARRRPGRHDGVRRLRRSERECAGTADVQDDRDLRAVVHHRSAFDWPRSGPDRPSESAGGAGRDTRDRRGPPADEQLRGRGRSCLRQPGRRTRAEVLPGRRRQLRISSTTRSARSVRPMRPMPPPAADASMWLSRDLSTGRHVASTAAAAALNGHADASRRRKLVSRASLPLTIGHHRNPRRRWPHSSPQALRPGQPGHRRGGLLGRPSPNPTGPTSRC